MRRLLTALGIMLMTGLASPPLPAATYSTQLASLRVANAAYRARAKSDSPDHDATRDYLRSNIEALFDAWEGTKWGMGLPQTSRPHHGKINCGTFVGTVLVHAGFDIDHKKLQRQPAELIIKSLAPKKKIRRFRNEKMKSFLEGVREMGPGLYIIGLDYHVGYLAVEENGDVRFIHAGVYPGKVVDEPAAGAQEIIESRYRVVGKILQKNMLDAWMEKKRIEVLGNW